MPQKSDKIAIVTVHGTGDTAASLDGQKWFQRGSDFSQRLLQHLRAKGVGAEIVPHLWSGANSAWEREQGANKLAQELRRLNKRYSTVHVIGHSHGGNVANDAAVLLKWGLRKRKDEFIESLTTVGTPFFNVRTGFLQVVAALLFVGIAWLSVVLFPIAAISWLVEIVTFGAFAQAPLWIAYVGGIGFALWFMLRISRRGARRVLRPKRGDRTTKTIFSIWHENDEAISFLQRVESLPIEPFPKGALFRGSRAAAISWGVLAVLLICVGIPILHALNIDVLGLNNVDAVEGAVETMEQGAAATGAGESTYSTLDNSIVAAIIGLLLAPGVFGLVYLLYRYIFGGFSEIGARGRLNRWISSVLRGIAMGRDGDQVLHGVATYSHTHKTDELKLSGPVHERMQTAANAAAEKLIEKYRWALFTVGSEGNSSLNALTSDTMTWDSLIHTTYFDQPETSGIIGDYIISVVKEQTFTPPAESAETVTPPSVQ